jgi:hypothetical protein
MTAIHYTVRTLQIGHFLNTAAVTRDFPADAGLVYDKAVVFGDMLKDTSCVPGWNCLFCCIR